MHVDSVQKALEDVVLTLAEINKTLTEIKEKMGDCVCLRELQPFIATDEGIATHPDYPTIHVSSWPEGTPSPFKEADGISTYTDIISAVY
jgi:hypothetical protein